MMLIGLMMPIMMTILNMTMFRLTLPTLRATFNMQADTTAWLVTAYSLPYMLFMPLYGRLGDELGKRLLFLAGISIFLTGAAISLAAPNLGFLFAGRTLQGIGAAGVSPLCIALISEHFPVSTRGKALGTWNSMGPVGGVIGPFLAGFLIDYIGWRTVFIPSLAVGLISFIAIQRYIPPVRQHRTFSEFFRRFDWGGVVLLSIAATVLIFFTSSRPITGVAALRDWRLLAGALFFFGGFILWEKRHRNPFVTLDIFRDKNFRQASLIVGIRMFTMNSIGFLIPLYLTDIHTLHATLMGVIVTLNAGALLVTMRMGGQLADRWGSRWPILVGVSIQMGSAVYFAWLPEHAALLLVALGLTAHGLGAGLSLAALHRTSMQNIPAQQMGIAAGLYSMIRFSGMTFGVALGGVMLQIGFNRSLAMIDAYQFTFRFIAFVAFVAVVLAWRLKESPEL